MKMPAEFYMSILEQWSGTPNEKAAQWEITYNDVFPPPLESMTFTSDQELADHLAESCDHEW